MNSNQFVRPVKIPSPYTGDYCTPRVRETVDNNFRTKDEDAYNFINKAMDVNFRNKVGKLKTERNIAWNVWDFINKPGGY